MSHYAQLDENNIVTQVIVVSNDDCTDANGNEVEEIGIAFCKKLLGDDTNWKQTSYNNNIRKRYAGLGYSYNEELDAFIPPQSFPSWTLNTETADWDAPVARPELTEEQITSLSSYVWNEETGTWDLTTPEPDGYKPDARDGDGDGMVQDGTDWERLVDS